MDGAGMAWHLDGASDNDRGCERLVDAPCVFPAGRAALEAEVIAMISAIMSP